MNSPRSEEEEVTTTNTSDDETDEDPMIYTSTSMREMGRENIEIVEQGMHHALACELPLESCCMLCTKMKCVLTHINCCLRRRLKGCDVCSTVISIVVFHARVCQVQVCSIPFCHDIRAAMLTYPPSSYHLVDLDHLIHRVITRLQDMAPAKNQSEDEDGEAKVAEEEEDIEWNPYEMDQVAEISSTTDN
ncbi:hypothetical protein CRE_03034 [Caenorhabditis remanei]|uniref:histone acetyltransferase n=1 Tax=Caenorhabditis remanei TaxID=31234 RepID=E3LW80_CAERE|nr:hypothetical protein CRE_03034 [Caenorhabditis remanei]